MNYKLILIIFFSLLISCSTDDDDYGINDRDDNINLFSNKARVVGYFPYYRFSINNQIEYCKVTHLNIAFANPVADGTIVLPSTDNTTLSEVVSRARSQNSNIKIYISICDSTGTYSDVSWLKCNRAQHHPIAIVGTRYLAPLSVDYLLVPLELASDTLLP